MVGCIHNTTIVYHVSDVLARQMAVVITFAIVSRLPDADWTIWPILSKAQCAIQMHLTFSV
jgi:hypothetical protein